MYNVYAYNMVKYDSFFKKKSLKDLHFEKNKKIKIILI